jgi:putative salt-induced outer membrane protein YdiY
MQTRTRCIASALIMLMTIGFATPVVADQLLMSNGDVITGDVSKIEGGKVFIKPAYADEFSVDVAEVVSIEADQTFAIELDDGNSADASFAHGDDGLQAVVVDGEQQAVPLSNISFYTAPAPWYERTSNVEANLTWNDGNTDSQNSLIFADTSVRLGDHRHYADLAFRRDKTDDDYTKKQDLFNYSYNWLFAKPWYTGATFKYEKDPIKDLDHRYTAGMIIGRDIFNEDGRFMTISLGGGYSEEQFGRVSDDGATAFWNLRYTQDFRGGALAFFHNHSIDYLFYGDNNTIFKTNTGFRFDIMENVYTNISLRYDYETEPVEGAENDDTTLVVGVGAKF